MTIREHLDASGIPYLTARSAEMLEPCRFIHDQGHTLRRFVEDGHVEAAATIVPHLHDKAAILHAAAAAADLAIRDLENLIQTQPVISSPLPADAPPDDDEDSEPEPPLEAMIQPTKKKK